MIRPDGVVLFSRRFPVVERRARLTAKYQSSGASAAGADKSAQLVDSAHPEYVRLPPDAFLVPELIQSFTDKYVRRPPILTFNFFCARTPSRPGRTPGAASSVSTSAVATLGRWTSSA